MDETVKASGRPDPDNPDRRSRRVAGMSRRRLSIVVALVAVGSLLLLQRQGVISSHTLHQWWPAGLILAGVWIAVVSWRR